MQPNGNVPGAGRPVAGAPMNNVNAKPAPVPTPPPTPAPKPAEPAFGNGGSVVEGKGGKKTGWILAVVFLLIVAAGGVGFGVWAMMDSNAQKDALNSQISALKQQNNDLQDKLNNGGDTVINIDADGNETNTADYIYVGEWGLKIKIPELLKDKISYIFTGESVEIIDESGFGVDSAVIRDGEYLKIFRSEAGEVDFENCEVSCTELFATINGFDYSGTIIGSDLSGPDFEALKEMASADSFSAI